MLKPTGATRGKVMDEQLFIADRAMLDGATELIACYGPEAAIEAGQRADASRDRGNVIHYCRWRQIERLIALLDAPDARGSLH